ncbi:hypothetical protein NV379_18820 [Paenibacillus sp. N1-5-1-14]|uniref:hypothetical protein n=1 Tax=Paenibacillus radicibacter TaxID=2972488 RepID=UPI002158CD89|nr:hypothetical protein [Paenibacillus radicibacter]MCR8644711.1 hypothetical protein [Paenibacillus radicibacter]
MRERLLSFANEYATDMDNMGNDIDELRSINHPLVFLFLGDQSEEALRQVHALNQKKWNNSRGVVYLHVGTKQVDAQENVYSWALPVHHSDKKTVRADMYKEFYLDEAKLLELNVTLRKMNSRMAEFGRMYTNMQRLNIAVITQVDDPSNVLLPEFTVLMKTIFGEHFRSVLIDVYSLMEEKQVEETFAFSSSLGVSFLREMDLYQSRTYAFNGMLQVTGEGIKMPVSHAHAPLFDMVYFLSDKDERGIYARDGMQRAYEMICNINFLKNKKMLQEIDPQHGDYNNQQFKQNMMPPDADGRCYVSAGYSKVKRPNEAIALTVLYHGYRRVMQHLKDNSKLDRSKVLEMLELESERSDAHIRVLMTEPAKAIEGMYGLLYNNVSLSELKTMTLRQAEIALYGNHAQSFFEMNVVRRVEAGFLQQDYTRVLERHFEERIMANPLYGYYSGHRWTSDTEGNSVVTLLREQVKETEVLLAQSELELEQKYEQQVDVQANTQLSLWNRITKQVPMRNIVRHILDEISELKLDIVFVTMKLKLLKLYLHKLEELHEKMTVYVERFDQLEKVLQESSRCSISDANDYLGRNINEYYEHVVHEILTELEERRGAQYYWDEPYFGNISKLLKHGEDRVVERFITMIRKDVLAHSLFAQSFEDELLERANVAASYDNRDVLSKEDLYRDLYATLENEAAIGADVYRSTHRHRYEEKYVFGDFHSEFVQYVFAIDAGSRIYKLGCVHERKPSGIEKLNLMGGFQMEDLMYYRNGKVYYDTYVQNGYAFHGIEIV